MTEDNVDKEEGWRQSGEKRSRRMIIARGELEGVENAMSMEEIQLVDELDSQPSN